MTTASLQAEGPIPLVLTLTHLALTLIPPRAHPPTTHRQFEHSLRQQQHRPAELLDELSLLVASK
jgi:hypothetical protein